MKLEEFNMMSKDQQEQALAYLEELEAESCYWHNLQQAGEECEEKDPVVICHCKPTYEYQSIEFEWFLTEDNKEDMKDLYVELLDFLVAYAPAQRNVSPKGKSQNNVNTHKEPKATERQLEILDDFEIPYKKGITKAEASELIKRSIENAGNKN